MVNKYIIIHNYKFINAFKGGEGTIIVEDFLEDTFFKLVDTSGFFAFNQTEENEFINIISGAIKQGHVIKRGNPKF